MWRHTSFEHVRYASVVVEAAHSLAERYNAKVGMTRSWGAIDDETKFEVIIDNLMNLELLWWASVRYVTCSCRYDHWLVVLKEEGNTQFITSTAIQ